MAEAAAEAAPRASGCLSLAPRLRPRLVHHAFEFHPDRVGEIDRIVMKADVALAVLALLSLCIGLRDPEQGLAVAPPDYVGMVVFQLEAEEAQHLAVEVLRGR